jgi:hypothetical protein
MTNSNAVGRSMGNSAGLAPAECGRHTELRDDRFRENLGRRIAGHCRLQILMRAAVWPFAVRAQQSAKMRCVGVLPAGYLQTDPEGQTRVAAFLDTLRKLGWSDGHNVWVEVRWSTRDICARSALSASLQGLS